MLPFCLAIIAYAMDPAWEESAPLTIAPATTETISAIQVSEQGTHIDAQVSASVDFIPGKLPDATLTGLPEELPVATRTIPKHHYCYLARFHGLSVTDCDANDIYPDTQLSALP